ncbi:MAG: 6,7-dimethyl-8-ribityllumazine synthase [Phycisphaerae bacterium]|nr:6,7-dimethyl-8-ribityllumazine synthase [Phycisphaerae bacterium]
MPKQIIGQLVLDAREQIALVVSRFNEFITSKLRDAAVDTLMRHGLPESNITEVWVPGAMELPLAAQRLARNGGYAAVIALGCVIRGGTPHFDYVAAETIKGLAMVSLECSLPIVVGVLTTDSIEQAVERAGTKGGNKGHDAALTAIEMVSLFRQIPKVKS